MDKATPWDAASAAVDEDEEAMTVDSMEMSENMISGHNGLSFNIRYSVLFLQVPDVGKFRESIVLYGNRKVDKRGNPWGSRF